MCGIAGVVRLTGERVDVGWLLSMRDMMKHRGPDDAGIYVSENVGLAHRRLSVIDLAGGHQPMCNENKRVWIVFNGEIYNYKELQRDLEGKGHRFRTSSDTEVILHLYEEEGVDCVKRLNGMFAFAIWDGNNRRLCLGRDRLGVKPLYYCLTKQAFLFASEIKALLQSREIAGECDIEKIPEYLLFRFVAGKQTLLKNIFNLLPAHVLVLEDNKVERRRYWELKSEPARPALEEVEYLANVSSLLEDSVRLRIRSDVPLGTFCSGGLDSSLVTALAASAYGRAINTFCVGFNEEEYDERRYARLVSAQYHTAHHELIIDNCEFADVLPKVIWHNDEPLNHANSVALYLISRYAKNFVTVILTGEGADELLGGYPRYYIALAAHRIRNLPSGVKQGIVYMLGLYKNRKLEKLAEGLWSGPNGAAVYNSAVVDRKVVGELLSKETTERSLHRSAYFDDAGCRDEDFFERFLLLELKTYLVSILNRQDKMTMAAGVEARVPFLDYRLVEYCSSIPYEWKLRGLQNKYLLKKLGGKFLAGKVIRRKKSGFGVPISYWLRDPKGMGRYLDLLRDTRFKQRGYFKQSRVEQIVSRHVAGSEDHGEILWSLINLELWQRLFIEDFPM